MKSNLFVHGQKSHLCVQLCNIVCCMFLYIRAGNGHSKMSSKENFRFSDCCITLMCFDC